MKTKLVGIFALLAAVTLSLSACGSSTSKDSTAATSAVPSASTIKTSTSSLGDILVAGSGRTIYMFTTDGNNATTSACTGACAQVWTAVTGNPAAGKGIKADLLGGSTQASYAGHLLYYYAQDAKPGDVNGQGVDGTWFVLDNSGAPIKTAASDGMSRNY